MTDSTIVLNGRRAAFSEGETLLDIARREGCYIPTLCSDSRLAPSGACRACLVEIEGQRRMAPACATIARSDMVVATRSERIDRHRKLLASFKQLLLSVAPLGRVPNDIGETDQLAGVIANGGKSACRIKRGTVFSNAPPLHFVFTFFLGGQVEGTIRFTGAALVRAVKNSKMLTDDFFRIVPYDVLSGGIPAYNPS